MNRESARTNGYHRGEKIWETAVVALEPRRRISIILVYWNFWQSQKGALGLFVSECITSDAFFIAEREGRIIDGEACFPFYRVRATANGIYMRESRKKGGYKGEKAYEGCSWTRCVPRVDDTRSCAIQGGSSSSIRASREYAFPFIERPKTTLNFVLTLFLLCSTDFYLSRGSRGNFEGKRAVS